MRLSLLYILLNLRRSVIALCIVLEKAGPERHVLTVSHYDVQIDPVVKMLGQKKPKGLLRAIWEQLNLEQIEGGSMIDPAWKRGFEACVFDGRKNVFTPNQFPLAQGRLEFAAS